MGHSWLRGFLTGALITVLVMQGLSTLRDGISLLHLTALHPHSPVHNSTNNSSMPSSLASISPPPPRLSHNASDHLIQACMPFPKAKPSVPLRKQCPARHPVDHGLRSTGRPALVVYTLTAHADVFDRHVEVDNYAFFQRHALFPQATPTALFTAVEYVVIHGNASDGNASVVDFGRSGNVRSFGAPPVPCDLCAEGRVIDALGGPAAMARTFEYVVFMNSGTRGPFFTEAAPPPDGGPAVTWIDSLALGGEAVYTGAVVAAPSTSLQFRPHIQSFAFGAPTSALPAVQPVFLAGCDTAPLNPLWRLHVATFDADMHKPNSVSFFRTQYGMVKVALRNTTGSPRTSAPEVTPSAATRDRPRPTSITSEVVAGELLKGRKMQLRFLENFFKRHSSVKSGGDVFKHWPKMKCVVRAEVQIMKTLLEAPLPPAPALDPDGDHQLTNESRANMSAPCPSCARPLVTDAQRAALSPVVREQLEHKSGGTFVAWSMRHNRTVGSMAQGYAVMAAGLRDTSKNPSESPADPCGTVMVKFGGLAWRVRVLPRTLVAEVQALSVGQTPRENRPVT